MRIFEKLKIELKPLFSTEDIGYILNEVEKLFVKYNKIKNSSCQFNEKDIILITYGDSISKINEKPLRTLNKFARVYLKGLFSTIHILPFFPYSSDDGFSVMDFKKVNNNLGSWREIKALSKDYNLVFDFVLNHISAKSEWFRKYLLGSKNFENLAFEVGDFDISKVIRPRDTDLLSTYVKNGKRVKLWTTFSRDQIDLNYKDPVTFTRMVEILFFYVSRGASIIRLDAIGAIWKKSGESCMNMDEVYNVVRFIKILCDYLCPQVKLLLEAKGPTSENNLKAGDLAYNFTLPPLLIYGFYKESSRKLKSWTLEFLKITKSGSFINILDTHDGIGLKPLYGTLNEDEINELVELTRSNGGCVSYYSKGGDKAPYELNITYIDALKKDKFLAACSVILSFKGIPAIYIHNLLGSLNDYAGVKKSGRFRSINRKKLNYDKLICELNNDSFRNYVYKGISNLIKIRKNEKCFHPVASLEVVDIDDRIFSYTRTSGDSQVLCMVNLSGSEINIKKFDITITPYGHLWLKNGKIISGNNKLT